MADFYWREGNSESVARFVKSDELDKNDSAFLSSDDVCAYIEDGKYTGYSSETVVNLNPKTGMLKRLLRGKIRREWLFINKGPHEIAVKFSARWGNGKSANGFTILAAQINPENTGRLLAMARSKGIVSTQDISDAVSKELNDHCGSAVAQFDTRDPARDQELRDALRLAADNSLRNHGIDVTKAIISWQKTPAEFYSDLEDDLNQQGLDNLGETAKGLGEISRRYVGDARIDAAEAGPNEAVTEAYAEAAEGLALDDIKESVDIIGDDRTTRKKDREQEQRMLDSKHVDEVIDSISESEDGEGDEAN